MSLAEIAIDIDDTTELPKSIIDWLEVCRQRSQLYWDQFAMRPLPQYVECDFEWVIRGLLHCLQQRWNEGSMFVEWGCGLGVITGAASLLGLEAIGIEAEPFLCDEARKLLRSHQVKAEIWQGNFLPSGASRLAEDADPLVALSHQCPSAYQSNQMALDDFAVIYAYPWPGEEHFLRSVFNRYARSSALMLMYRGPYQLELFRKQ